MELKKTSLYDKHLQLKAKMAPFAGYDMPIQYTSVKDESLSVRKNVGMFDVSHMGEFWVEGKEATSFIDSFLPNDILTPPIGKAIYSPLCDNNGNIIDDLIVYKVRADKILICVNASNIEKDWNWVNSLPRPQTVKLTNASENFSLIALQGPKAEEVLFSILNNLAVKNLGYYTVAELVYNNESVVLARTGYTGEDGFEIFCSHKMAQHLWDKLLEKKVVPCGLASRDVLRLEAGFPLYGQELNNELTPLDAGLKWTVKLNKNNFVGKSALEKYNSKYIQVKLILENGIPRPNYKVENANGEEIGVVTSGTMSVILEKGIALAQIDRNKNPSDKKYFVNIRDKKYSCNVTTKPFVTGGHK